MKQQYTLDSYVTVIKMTVIIKSVGNSVINKNITSQSNILQQQVRAGLIYCGALST